MNAVALILVLLALGGLGCVLAAVGKLWALGVGADDSVGSRLPREPKPAAPAIVPGSFRSLMHGEMVGWKHRDQWGVLVRRLDELEVSFGGQPAAAAPESFSAEWLDQRISRIEELAGPLPAPLRPFAPPTRSRLPWKKT